MSSKKKISFFMSVYRNTGRSENISDFFNEEKMLKLSLSAKLSLSLQYTSYLNRPSTCGKLDMML